MPILAAERSFDEGLMALAEGRWLAAVVAFRAALEIERSRHTMRPSALFLSYYGLSLAHVTHSSSEAVAACRAAVVREPSHPVYLLNLGRVHLIAGRRVHALECFRRGVSLAPGYRPLLDELCRLERHSEPLKFAPIPSRVVGRVLDRAREARVWRVKRRRTA
jgi:hypothetical protein